MLLLVEIQGIDSVHCMDRLIGKDLADSSYKLLSCHRMYFISILAYT